MKKFYIMSLGFLAALGVQAQNDTLIWENFNGTWTDGSTETEAITELGNTMVFELAPGLEGDDKWYSIDLDGFTDANDRPLDFFRALALATADSAIFDGTMASSSWFTPFAKADNWLITPYFYCTADAQLSWFSAPRQTPLFLDGYKVKISVASNDPTDFTSTVFTAKEFTAQGAGDSCNYANYTFAPAGAGFVHGADGTNITDNGDVPADCSRNWGLLKKQTISLSQFANKRIYVAFVHDSDDDNLITIDNVLVTGTLVDDSKIEENDKFSFTAYPNPAIDRITLGYQLTNSTDVTFKVIDNTGRTIMLVNAANQNGNASTTIDVSELAAGIYSVTMETADSKATKKFIKK